MSSHPTDLRAALIAAFPPAPITRAMIDEPTAGWANYEERDDLATLERRTWTELDRRFIERHASLLVFAGSAIYRAVLPAFLLYLLEHDAYNEVPFHVAGQLSRKDDPTNQRIFDRRIAPLTAEQRAVVRHVIQRLATREPMQDVMLVALRTWDHLSSAAI